MRLGDEGQFRAHLHAAAGYPGDIPRGICPRAPQLVDADELVESWVLADADAIAAAAWTRLEEEL